MSTRIATLDDLDLIVNLMGEFTKERLPFMSFDEAHNRAVVSHLMNFDTFVAILLNSNDGLICGVKECHVYNAEPIAKEMVWYTRDTNRTGGIRLLKRFSAWAEENGCYSVSCGMPGTRKSMERLGFVPFEIHYTHFFAGTPPELVFN